MSNHDGVRACNRHHLTQMSQKTNQSQEPSESQDAEGTLPIVIPENPQRENLRKVLGQLENLAVTNLDMLEAGDGVLVFYCGLHGGDGRAIVVKGTALLTGILQMENIPSAGMTLETHLGALMVQPMLGKLQNLAATALNTSVMDMERQRDIPPNAAHFLKQLKGEVSHPLDAPDPSGNSVEMAVDGDETDDTVETNADE